MFFSRRLQRCLFYILLPSLSVFQSQAEEERFFADYFYLAPETATDKSAQDPAYARRYPMPERQVRRYVAADKGRLHFSEFRHDYFMEEKRADVEPTQIALGKSVNEKAPDFFAQVPSEKGMHIFLAELSSEDAAALRLRVNLCALQPGEELWLLDSRGDAAFGPFTQRHARPEGNWLPTTAGDRAVLLLRTPRKECPLLEIQSYSHFFKSIFNPSLRDPKPCHLDASAAEDPRAQEISTAVGILIIPRGNTQSFCTGTLINSLGHDDATLPEPYLISAGHCFEGGPDVAGMEVFWDYRSETDDPATLPRSSGASLVHVNHVLDGALLRLEGEVPSGPFGRAWAGWDSLRPVRQSLVQCFHYPVASSMKLSRGLISLAKTDVCKNILCTSSFERQIKINWYEGIAEAGSSGSPLLLPDFNFRIIGMLSNGNDHSCRSSQNNFDHFAAFHEYFPEIKCHLVPGEKCADPVGRTASGCFLRRLFCLNSETLADLYRFRSGILEKSSWGRSCIDEYYSLAPVLENWFNLDPLAKEAFGLVVEAAAFWGHLLQD